MEDIVAGSDKRDFGAPGTRIPLKIKTQIRATTRRELCPRASPLGMPARNRRYCTLVSVMPTILLGR
jgi:hypothetical protein